MTTPRETFRSAANTRLAGSVLPMASRPSAMAARSSLASHSARPPVGAASMLSCRKSAPEPVRVATPWLLVLSTSMGLDLATGPLWPQSGGHDHHEHRQPDRRAAVASPRVRGCRNGGGGIQRRRLPHADRRAAVHRAGNSLRGGHRDPAAARPGAGGPGAPPARAGVVLAGRRRGERSGGVQRGGGARGGACGAGGDRGRGRLRAGADQRDRAATGGSQAGRTADGGRGRGDGGRRAGGRHRARRRDRSDAGR